MWFIHGNRRVLSATPTTKRHPQSRQGEQGNRPRFGNDGHGDIDASIMLAEVRLSRRRPVHNVRPSLKDQELKTSRTWAVKSHFRWFWEYRYAGNARKYFKQWYGRASRSRLQPIIKVAKMLKRHLDNILSYFRYRITNAMSKGFNTHIQTIKSQARGFRAFANYRTRILFHCGNLNLLPDGITH